MPTDRTPSGANLARLVGQLVRFIMSGGGVAIVSWTLMAVLYALAGLPEQIALILAYVGGLSVHFFLNREWVFRSDSPYHLRPSAQALRYVGLALVSYGITAVALATLPGLLGVHPLVVYYGTSAALAVMTFIVLRLFVFRSAPAVGTR